MRQTLTICATLAALALAAPAAMAEGSMTNGKFCLNGPGSAKNCKYDTMAACEKDKKTGQQCAANSTTTGTAPAPAPSNSMKK